MVLEKLVFDLNGTKVHISTQPRKGKGPIYTIEALVETHDSDIYSYIDYDTTKGEFIDKPDGLFLELSLEEEEKFKEELNEIYLVLMLEGHIHFKEQDQSPDFVAKEAKSLPQEGPAIWTDPEPPADYTFKPVDSDALRDFLKVKKNQKDKADSLCIQFFDNGEDEESRESVRQLENAGYNVSYVPTSGASALMVNEYEVSGRTAISGLVKQLIEDKKRFR